MHCIDYLLLSLKTDATVEIGPSWLSGLISEEYNKHFPKITSSDNGHTYRYPRLQYKIIRNNPMIASINEGCSLLWDLYEKFDQPAKNHSEWHITEKRLIDKKASFGICDEYKKYRFLTPWLSMPEENFKTYLSSNLDSRERMINKILHSQITAMSQSLGFGVDDRLRVKALVKPNYIFQRDIYYVGMFGSFIANFEIPGFLGIGKSVSRGFGTIKQI